MFVIENYLHQSSDEKVLKTTLLSVQNVKVTLSLPISECRITEQDEMVRTWIIESSLFLYLSNR